MPDSVQPSPVKNVLFIMVDQLRWDYLGCTGHPTLQTPNVDQLARRGVLFGRTYVQSPICGPSRMSYYTGRYVSSHRSTWLMVPLPLSERTMGDYLRENGRNLSLIGKSHFLPDRKSIERLGGLSDPDRSEYAMEGGFENIARDDGIFGRGPIQTKYADYLRANGYDSPNPWHDFANSAEGPDGEILSGWHLRYAKEPARVADQHGETAYTTDRAIEFIEGKGDDPWALHLSYIKPHWPYVVSAPYNAMYGPADVIPANRASSELTSANPVYKAMADRQESREFMRDEVREAVVPVYMGLIKQLDDHFGRLFAVLEGQGRMDDTLIVFTSDHGDYLGDHWMGEKEFFHEESVRVPMIIYDPRAQADATRGTTSTQLVESIDLIPTFLESLGFDGAPEALEGKSLIPLLHGKDVQWRETVFSELDYAFHADVRKDLDRSVDECRGYMAFDGRWKFIFWEGFPPMLFDHESDPNERVDLGQSNAHSAVCKRMEKVLFSWLRGLKNRTTVDNKFVEEWRDKEFQIGQW
jgi:arylsulfatase A-like enzyme